MSNFAVNFKCWLESKQESKYVFCDLDETLIHRIDRDWLTTGTIGSQEGKVVDVGDRKQYIYERPHARQFLSDLKKFSKVYILTHAEDSHAHHAIKAMKFDQIIDGCFVTRNLSPRQLGERFDLKERPWVLVDNMPLDSIEMVNKMLILSSSPSAEHFIKVEPWYPVKGKITDNELLKALRSIKHKFQE